MMRGQPPIFFRRTATGKGKGNERKEDDTPIPGAATERIQPQPLLSAPSNLQAYKAATATEPSTHCVINDRNIQTTAVCSNSDCGFRTRPEETRFWIKFISVGF